MIRTTLFLAGALAFVVSLTGTSAVAQEPVNQLTYFTFSAPFELPGGKTLPAGKYAFKIIDSPSNRHVIQVMSADQTEMHATILAIPAQRMDAADEPEVRFMEAEANAAPAIRTWWYPGRTIGHEFIYPKDQARRLAARQSEGVLTVADDSANEDRMRAAELSRIGADGREVAVDAEATTENAQASQPTSGRSAATTTSERTTAQASSRPAPESSTGQDRPAAPTTQGRTTAPTAPDAAARSARATTASSERTELPRTASPLPLYALIGLGSLLGAGALRLRR